MDQWQDRYRGAMLFGLVVLVLAGVALFQLRKPLPPPVILETPAPVPSAPLSAPPTATPRPLRVYVSGAVQQPDVYSLPAESIVKDALLAAGGATLEADLDRINLAMALVNGQHVYIPRKGEEAVPVEMPAGTSRPSLEVNINSATQAELETLPGIGPALAQRIVEYRQAHGAFATIEDIMQVSGIGEATFSKIRDSIATK